MELFKLDSTTHLPSTTITNFDSLVWSERFQTEGDFKLVVENDISVLTDLPLGVLISHTDTKDVMIVENHEIVRDAKKKLTVTVTGRSFETFSENRITLGCDLGLETAGVANVETVASSTSADVVYYLLRGRLQPSVASADDAIANLLVRKDMRVLDATFNNIIKRGTIYERVLEFLKLGNADVKVVRPNGAQTTLDLVIHDGADRTTTVIFYAQNEDLENASYFWSNKNYRNYANVSGKTTARNVRSRDVGTNQQGMNRRNMYVEARDLEGNFVPGTSTDVLAARAQINIDEHKPMTLLQATISKTATPKFKINYDVGDLVTAYGEFAIASTMRVTEHILTVDKTGMQGYPSLSAP